MATTLYNPVFTVYNEALSKAEKQFVYTNSTGQTSLNPPEDEVEDGLWNATPPPAMTGACAQFDQHVAAIKLEASTRFGSASPGTKQLSDAGSKRYQMEQIDVKHRMGDYLVGALEQYQQQRGKIKSANFWEWVTQQSNDDTVVKSWNPNLYQSSNPLHHQHYLAWFQKGVKYVASQEGAERYRVEIVSGIMKRKFRDGDNDRGVFSTEQLIEHYRVKKGFTSTCIWVMSSDHKFYSHLVKIGRFHHSSLLGGQAIAGGGEWGTSNSGVLLWINSHSGHYRPGTDTFVSALDALQQKQALQQAKVRLYEKGAKSASQFKQEVAPADFVKEVKQKSDFYSLQGLEPYFD